MSRRSALDVLRRPIPAGTGGGDPTGQVNANWPTTRDPWLWPYAGVEDPDGPSIWNAGIAVNVATIPAMWPELDNAKMTIDEINLSGEGPIREMRTIDFVYSNTPNAKVAVKPSFPIPAGTLVYADPRIIWNARWNGLARYRLAPGTPGWRKDMAFVGQAVDVDHTDTANPERARPGWAYTPPTHLDGTGPFRGWDDLRGQGIRGPHGGGGGSLGGTIMEWEWDLPITTPGDYFGHALSVNPFGKLCLSHEGTGFVWPAVKADGGFADPANGNYYALTDLRRKMGAMLTLPASYDFSWITHPLVLKFAMTFFYMGGIVADNSKSSRYSFSMEHTLKPKLAGMPPVFHAEMKRLMTDLHIVLNNGPSNPGGGSLNALRRMPRAIPPLAA